LHPVRPSVSTKHELIWLFRPGPNFHQTSWRRVEDMRGLGLRDRGLDGAAESLREVVSQPLQIPGNPFEGSVRSGTMTCTLVLDVLATVQELKSLRKGMSLALSTMSPLEPRVGKSFALVRRQFAGEQVMGRIVTGALFVFVLTLDRPSSPPFPVWVFWYPPRRCGRRSAAAYAGDSCDPWGDGRMRVGDGNGR
jgi:hypothetical protein